MIPRPQHFGDRAPFPCHWSGIVRIFEKPRLEAFLLSAGGRAHYPGKEAHASVEDDHRAELAAGEDIVADRDGFYRPRVEDALVESLEAAAQQNDALARRELADAALGQRAPPRCQRQYRPRAGVLGGNAIERRGEDVRAKHHSRSAAGGRVVDAAVLVGREIADVRSLKAPDPPFQSSSGEADTHRALTH